MDRNNGLLITMIFLVVVSISLIALAASGNLSEQAINLIGVVTGIAMALSHKPISCWSRTIFPSMQSYFIASGRSILLAGFAIALFNGYFFIQGH